MLTVNGATGDYKNIWFTTKEYPALFVLDREKNETKLVKILDRDYTGEDNMYGAVRKCNNKIYIAPLCGDKVFIYNITNDTLSEYLLFNSDYKGKFKFRSSICKNNHIYFIGCSLAAVLEIDTETDEINFIPFFGKELVFSNENNVIATTNNNIIYWAGAPSGEIIEFNIDKKTIKSVDKYECTNCIGICNLKSKALFISSDKGEIVEKNNINRENTILQLPKSFKPKYRNYSAVICDNNDVWLIPFKSNMIMKYEAQYSKIRCIKEYLNNGNIVYINAGEYEEGYIWGFNTMDGSLDIINTDSEMIDSYHIGDIENIEELSDWYIKNAKIVKENKGLDIDLKRYIYNLVGKG